MLLIRELTREEFDPALALAWSVFLEYEAPDYSDEGVAEFRKILCDTAFLETLRFYGAYEDGVLVGVLATRNNGSHIALFFVDGSYHRRGIGKALFAKACAQHPTKKMTVNSSPYAVEVYRRLGFCETDSEQVTKGIRYIPMSREC